MPDFEFFSKLVSKNVLKIIFWFLIILISWFKFNQLFYPGYYFDTVTTQYEWGKNAFEMGIFGFYQNYNGFFDYLPGNLTFLYFIYGSSSIFGGTPAQFVIFLKSAAWLSEIFASVLLYKFAKKYLKSHKKPFILAGLFYAAPSVWIISNVWGQNDTLAVVFGFISIYFAYKFRQNEEKTEEFYSEKLEQTSKKLSVDKPFYQKPVFLAGLFFVIGMWFKLQIVLVLPIIILLLWKKFTWQEIAKMLVFLLSLVLIGFFANQSFTKGLLEQTRLILVASLTFVTVLIAVGKKIHFLKTDVWNFLLIVFVGLVFVGGTFSFLGLEKLGGALFAPIGRNDSISNGAATFWSVIQPEKNQASFPIIQFGNFNLTVSTLGLLIYIICFLFLLITIICRQNLFSKSEKSPVLLTFKNFLVNLPNYLNKLKWNLFSVSFVVFYTCGIYFLFFTKMHSRYLHFTILASFFLLAFEEKLWKKFSFWLAFTMLHLGYFLNQIAVYAGANPDPGWVTDLLNGMNFNAGILSGIFMFSGFCLVSKLAWKYYGKSDNSN